MAWLSKVFGGGAGSGIKEAGEGVKTALDSGGGFLKSIRTAITGVDPDSKARIEEALTGLQSSLQDGRQKIDEMTLQIAMRSKNPIIAVFLAGWRPFIGWVAGMSLFFYFLPQYVMGSIIWARAAWMAVPYMSKEGVLIIPQIPAYPVSADGLLELVFAMLGLAIARTVEKFGSVEGNH